MKPEIGTRSLPQAIRRERLETLFEAFGGLTLSVVGDLGLDAYWYADMTRSFLSRETPRYPRPVIGESYTPGAGANVAANVKALGVGTVSVVSVLGEDWRGEILLRLLEERGIETEGVASSEKRSTTTYIKPILKGYDSEQEDSRIDFENGTPLDGEDVERLHTRLHEEFRRCDGVIVADQLEINGTITDRCRRELNLLAGRTIDTWCVVDSRVNIAKFENMVLKPNWAEAMTTRHPENDIRTFDHDSLAQIGAELSNRNNRPVFITLSGEGVLVCAGTEIVHLAAASTHPPLDPVGAGDTFIAALTAALSAGASPVEAGAVASLAAGVTVEKLNQTGTATPQEILDKYDVE